jgi:hypothetical protein
MGLSPRQRWRSFPHKTLRRSTQIGSYGSPPTCAQGVQCSRFVVPRWTRAFHALQNRIAPEALAGATHTRSQFDESDQPIRT